MEWKTLQIASPENITETGLPISRPLFSRSRTTVDMTEDVTERKRPEITDPYPWPSIEADACLLLVGDVNLQNREDPSSAFRHVEETLSEADVLYGNLEGCLFEPGDDDIPKKDRWQHSEERMIEGITSAGFDVLGGANNVMYGEEAVGNTIRVLEREGIHYCGVGTDRAAAREPAVVTKHGVTVGFVQRTARYYGTEALATERSPGVAAFDPEDEENLDEIEANVASLRSEVDVLVFSYHLRDAETTETKPYQRELARRVIDAGADLVFGDGAHVNQGVELYRGRPVFHCIGQFAFDWAEMEHRRDGLLLRAHVTGDHLSRLSFVPVYRDENNDVYLAPPDSTEGRRQLDEIRSLSPVAPFTVTETEAVISLPNR